MVELDCQMLLDTMCYVWWWRNKHVGLINELK